MICDVIASISAAVAGSSVWNGGGGVDFAASCACCCAAAISANAAIPTHCDNQSRRVDCIYQSCAIWRPVCKRGDDYFFGVSFTNPPPPRPSANTPRHPDLAAHLECAA